MSRKIKDQPIGARISSEMREEIDIYLEAADISMGELVRKSLREYLWAHPIQVTEKGPHE